MSDVGDDDGVDGNAGLDRQALANWCSARLGSEPERVIFEAGYLSQVLGLHLRSGRDVVVKVRPWQERLVSCARVQSYLATRDFPAPHVLVAPEQVGALAVSAEALVAGGDLLALRDDSADRFAEALAWLVDGAPDAHSVGELSPSPAWVGWDHAGDALWPEPDDREGDLNEVRRDGWLDEVGTAARARLRALDRPLVVGHCDWYSQNLRWIDRTLHVVHDWDSIVAQPEAAIVGQAAAIWPGFGLPGQVASVPQSERFLEAYLRARDRSWTDAEIRASWAAGLWTRAFDAKKATLSGDDPGATLTPAEARERSRLAGL